MNILLKPIDPCSTCVGWGWGKTGYVPASGSGDNGVLVVAEAAGENEAIEGIPLVGKAGHYLWQQLARAGIDREGFRCHNALSCRPPNNKLSKMAYEAEAIAHCSPLLDQTILSMQELCRSNGKTFTIITLGQIAFRRILGLEPKNPILREDYLCYPIWSDRYKAYVLAVDHPSYLMRGNNHLVPVLQYGFKRALEIAEHGLTLDTHDYLLDPAPATFAGWVRDYLVQLDHDRDNTFLSYDIETPYKRGKSEGELANEESDDYQILRVSFAYRPNEAVSVPWQADYLPYLEQLFTSEGKKVGWNSAGYDDPRIMARVPINGDRLDGMLCWHVLNSALDKSLGFVTPFYVKTTGMWKHMSESAPAFYNAKDADMALRDFLGIKADLERAQLWPVYERHVVQLNRALTYMSGKGVLRDEVMRSGAEKQLSDLLDVTELQMEAAVPVAARRMKVYKKQPKLVTQEMVCEERFYPVDACTSCGLLKPGRWKKHTSLCSGRDTVSSPQPQKVWLQPLEFKVSKLGLTNYQRAMCHQAVTDRRTQKVTFDESAIMKLMKHHPNDPLYPLILQHREYQKLASTYIGITQPDGRVRGGMPIGLDGAIHTLFTHNPSTLRLASQNPNLQNLPRPKGIDDLQTIIRNLIMARPGHIFTARDYSGIEAVLVGYFASAKNYIRLAKLDVHSMYTAYALNALDGRVTTAELPDISWPDDKLIPALADIKSRFKYDRNQLYKHLVHGGNFAQTPKGAAEKIFKETGVEYPVKTIAKVMDVYFALFPEIKRWHVSLLNQAEKDGFLRNPFGYVHRFYKVYSYERIGGQWSKKPGDDANRVIAFLPQSTAAGIIKEAILRLYHDRFDEAGQYLRLQVHDEVFAETPENLRETVDLVMREEMEKPIPELALPTSYGMGPMLSIDTEAKWGARWGQMH